MLEFCSLHDKYAEWQQQHVDTFSDLCLCQHTAAAPLRRGEPEVNKTAAFSLPQVWAMTKQITSTAHRCHMTMLSGGKKEEVDTNSEPKSALGLKQSTRHCVKLLWNVWSWTVSWRPWSYNTTCTVNLLRSCITFDVEVAVLIQISKCAAQEQQLRVKIFLKYLCTLKNQSSLSINLC